MAIHAKRAACYYCGDPADSTDHCIPRNVLKRLHLLDDPLSLEIRQMLPKIATVSACRECNSVLGGCPHRNMAARAYRIAEYFRRRYRRWLTLPAWNDSELMELGYALRSVVVGAQSQRERAHQRLAWARGRAGTYSPADSDEVAGIERDIEAIVCKLEDALVEGELASQQHGLALELRKAARSLPSVFQGHVAKVVRLLEAEASESREACAKLARRLERERREVPPALQAFNREKEKVSS